MDDRVPGRAGSPARWGELEFRRLLEKLPAGAYMCDATGLITYYNQHAVDLWGRAPKLNDSVDRFCGSFKLFAPDGTPLRHEECWMALALRMNREYDGEEIIVQRPDGRRMTVLAYASPIHDDSGGLLGAVNVLVDITERKRDEQRLSELNGNLEQRVAERTAVAERRATQLQVLTSELTQAEQRERRRLAEVLHDHLQQLLVGAQMQAGALRSQADDRDMRGSLERVVELIGESLAVSRSLTTELSPPVLYDGGLIPALGWLADQMKEKHNLTVEVEADDGAEPDADDTRAFCFQAVRELLFNTAKHAETDRASVALSPEGEDRIRLVIEDAGAGFDARAAEEAGVSKGGFGLFSIRERLEMIGGELTIESAPGRGTRMTLIAPRCLPTDSRPHRPRTTRRSRIKSPPPPTDVVDAAHSSPTTTPSSAAG